MHFGQFNLMGYRRPGTPPHEIYDAAVAQVKAAEQADFAISWFAEHHFSNYSVCPSPLMMVARCAGETSRIRLGSGVVIVPLYQPARLLSEIGMVDSLTHGRLVLGIGSGYQPYEFERFGEDLSHSTEKLLEFMEMLELAVGQETFSYAGRHLRMPETHVASRPMAGLPDVWVAGDNPALHRLAARRGYVVMVTPRHFTAEMLAAARQRFEATYREAGQDPRRMRFAALRHICVTDSRAEAAGFLDEVRHQIRLSQSLRHREQAMAGSMLVEKPWPGEASLEEMAGHMLVGSPEMIAERMAEEIRRAEPCHYLLQSQAGGSSLPLALRSIERFARDVRPLLERAVGPLERIGAGGAAMG
ncbi:LLM class flavin-dependent oxidoreductase [Siccirubricoccus sp. G192]|uniref:LLM class flavin-dependent oxidoreductase n=1 Tax=Siccirubricoccus sp. G192 TaxID=2849651 RepID=UPI001C2BC04D|nr:LLM class flavin-dependent oxidoreductase [Siccirubricoccus sp. G192]MBV1800236.1 LLM class flavin-dependent oxidoreductase [Siccirubricoccus sp. G192]